MGGGLAEFGACLELARQRSKKRRGSALVVYSEFSFMEDVLGNWVIRMHASIPGRFSRSLSNLGADRGSSVLAWTGWR